MKHPNDTRVRFVPDPRRDQPQESHSGKVIYFGFWETKYIISKSLWGN